MRLWHQDLIAYIPYQQLLGQHREICAMRGKGWKRKHQTVDYVYTHPYQYLYQFHLLVIQEMEKRGYQVNPLWKDPCYRGIQLGYEVSKMTFCQDIQVSSPIYPEHNEAYLKECLDNLHQKGIDISL